VEDDVIEAVEGILPEHFVLGLQWHPEQTQKTSSASRAIFAYFLQMARSWRPRAVRESVGQ
jgi:putative glutamine amidotransferase